MSSDGRIRQGTGNPSQGSKVDIQMFAARTGAATLAILGLAAITWGGLNAQPKACAVVGDSIALDIGPYLRDCAINAKIGISSLAIIPRVPPNISIVVVSAGSNDSDSPHLLGNLQAIRKRATGQVIWIVPALPRARELVFQAAKENMDFTVEFQAGKDGVHPKSYRPMAASIRRIINVIRAFPPKTKE